ncbi:MAG: outer membrane beta-barrel protein [Bacteroidetes bacterium]|nr:outer membrane beta-barrel protein [Bacteroidota bacterium]
MENNLDKYFKDNLHDRKFEMKEEYWLGAEKLLDAQDKRRKRRVVFWWFGGGLGALILVGFSFWIFSETNGKKTAYNTSNIAVQSMPTEASTSLPNKENSGNEPVQMSKLEPLENQLSNIENTSNFHQDIRTTNKQPTENQTIAQSISSKGSVVQSILYSSDKLKNNTKIINTQSLNPEISNPDFSTNSEIKNTKNQVSEILDLNLKEAEEIQFEKMASPNFLAVLPYFVTGDLSKRDLSTSVQDIDVANPPRLHIGLLASQLLIPNPRKDEKTFIGQRAGLVVRYDFRNEFYLSSGLQYLHRTGTFDASKSATQRNYRFGLEIDTLELRTTSLHYAGIPVLLGWEHNQHQLEAGFLLDFLTGVRGETGSYQKQGEPPVKVFKTEKSGWVNSDGYRRITPTLQLTYRYNIVGHWSLGLSANYMIGGILDNNFIPPVNSYLLKETEKFQLGAQVVYLLN